MKTPHYIILAIIILLSGWIGYLLKTCPDEYPPEFIYIQDTRKVDSLTKIINQGKADLIVYRDSTKNLKSALSQARKNTKVVIEQSPCPEVMDVVAVSDSICDAVIEFQGNQLSIASMIISAQDSVISDAIDLHRKDSADVTNVMNLNLKLEKKVKRKNTWLKCGAAVFAAELIRQGIKTFAK